MSPGEAAGLKAVTREFEAVEAALLVRRRERPMESAIRRALDHLDATYSMRLYAAFEAMVRARFHREFDDPEPSLGHMVQRMVGGEAVFDRAEGYEVPWWRILTRDRNMLMHGDMRAPLALDLDLTRKAMEAFLNRLDGDRSA